MSKRKLLSDKKIRDLAVEKAESLGIANARELSNKMLARKVGILPSGYANIGSCKSRKLLYAWVLGNQIPSPESIGGYKKKEKIAPQKKEYSPRVSEEKAASPDFLHTYEWRRVRMEALKKYGARCQCCGANPDDGVRIHVDHIKPRKLFPELALDVNNLQVLCEECNHGKGNWDMTDWRRDAVSHLKSITED